MLYFAYGSNLDWAQIQRRCPSVKFIAVAALRDHRFAITRRSRLRGCGTADVVAQASSEVWGVVYEIDERDLPELDRFEDGYTKEQRQVYVAGDGKGPLEVMLYIAEKQEDPPPPSPEYKRLVVEGAKYWQLPSQYVTMLEQIETEGSCS